MSGPDSTADSPVRPPITPAPSPYPLPPTGAARSPAGVTTALFGSTLLLTLAVLGGFVTQTWHLVEDRRQLQQVQRAQQAQVDASTQLRGSLDALANATARLASAGNVNAATVVKALRDRGITINPPAASTPPPK